MTYKTIIAFILLTLSLACLFEAEAVNPHSLSKNTLAPQTRIGIEDLPTDIAPSGHRILTGILMVDDDEVMIRTYKRILMTQNPCGIRKNRLSGRIQIPD
ncbi:MAG: hypothetical protein JW774_07170 [Candidatus Aureabacteria bacterium]|nr:hypothetical protein [Candidatus Auribacterota bacterium]